LGSTRRSPTPQRWPNRCRHCSPTDALIDLKVRRRLGRFVPIWLNLDTLAHGRVAPVPQRRPESGDLTFEITGPTPLYRAAFGGFAELGAVRGARLVRAAALLRPLVQRCEKSAVHCMNCYSAPEDGHTKGASGSPSRLANRTSVFPIHALARISAWLCQRKCCAFSQRLK
jgi:hypothetical protein